MRDDKDGNGHAGMRPVESRRGLDLLDERRLDDATSAEREADEGPDDGTSEEDAPRLDPLDPS